MLNYKKYLAAALAATMVVGSSTIAFAATSPSNFTMSGSDVATEDRDENNATGTINGSGELEGFVEEDVFKVEVPTIPADSSLFNFILDPQGLIEKTEGAAFNTAAGSTVTFTDNTTMYFKNEIDKAAGGEDYSNKSDYVVLKNKGTMDVDAAVTAKVKNLEVAGGAAIEMAASSNFAADDETTSIYLALVDGKSTPTTKVLTADTAGVKLESGVIAKSSTPNLYKVTYDDATDKYMYGLNPDVAPTATYNEFKFALTGASNPNGDWSQLTAAAPEVEVVWSVVAHSDDAGPSITPTTAANTGVAVDVTVNLGTGTKAASDIAKIEFEDKTGATQTLDSANYTFENSVLRFRASYVSGLTGTRVYTIYFNDTANTTAEFTLTK